MTLNGLPQAPEASVLASIEQSRAQQTNVQPAQDAQENSAPVVREAAPVDRVSLSSQAQSVLQTQTENAQARSAERSEDTAQQAQQQAQRETQEAQQQVLASGQTGNAVTAAYSRAAALA